MNDTHADENILWCNYQPVSTSLLLSEYGLLSVRQDGYPSGMFISRWGFWVGFFLLFVSFWIDLYNKDVFSSYKKWSRHPLAPPAAFSMDIPDPARVMKATKERQP